MYIQSVSDSIYVENFVAALLVILFVNISAFAKQSQADTTAVKGYTKKDGTVITGYTRQKKTADINTQQVAGYTRQRWHESRSILRERKLNRP